MASTSSSFTCQFEMPLSTLGERSERRVPYFLRVFGDGSVGRKPADVGCARVARTPPSLLIAPDLVELHSGSPICIENNENHKIIVVHKGVREAAIVSVIVDL